MCLCWQLESDLVSQVSKMKKWLYKWLPIIFGCHCKKERSFHYKGEQFPICARCTGELVGMLIALFSCFFWRCSIWVCFLLMIPMVLDGCIQMWTSYNSTNRRRFLTGLFFGYALLMLIVVTSLMTIQYGMKLGRSFR